MTPKKVRQKILSERAAWIRDLIEFMEALPLKSRSAFTSNRNTVAAGESYLRRCLEALFDLGRHIITKGFGVPATEYKQVARELVDKKVVSGDFLEILIRMAGYRNRMTHFYDEVTPDELYTIITKHRKDIKTVLNMILTWQHKNPEMIDTDL